MLILTDDAQRRRRRRRMRDSTSVECGGVNAHTDTRRRRRSRFNVGGVRRSHHPPCLAYMGQMMSVSQGRNTPPLSSSM